MIVCTCYVEDNRIVHCEAHEQGFQLYVAKHAPVRQAIDKLINSAQETAQRLDALAKPVFYLGELWVASRLLPSRSKQVYRHLKELGFTRRRMMLGRWQVYVWVRRTT